MADSIENEVLSDDEYASPSQEDFEEKNTSNSALDNEKKNEKKGKRSKRDFRKPHSVQIERQDAILEAQRLVGYRIDKKVPPFLEHLCSQAITANPKLFKDQLMMPEAMDVVPSGFAKNWTLFVTPTGSRCMVVTNKGYTSAYSKSGHHIISHPSHLPNGSKLFHKDVTGPCVLDCIYSEDTMTYYTLDMMFWEGQPLYDLDTPTRFKILQEKLKQCDAMRPYNMNPYPFIPLRSYIPTKNNIWDALSQAQYEPEGIVFYHKLLRYTPNTTPLMLWLVLDDLPYKMNIEIPEMGIMRGTNYNNPVALALAHGVSPSIIAQAYPQGPMAQRHQMDLYQATYLMDNLRLQDYNYNNNNRRGGPRSMNQSQQKGGKNANKKKVVEDYKQANWGRPHPVMRSEWMFEKPDNFEEDYLVCVCPQAKRRIVVAAFGTTCIYNKLGHLLEVYTSNLPNGSSTQEAGSKSNDLTILDCLWCGSQQIMYVIDVIHWKQTPFYEAEAEFRFFWLSDKLTNINLKLKDTSYPLELLPKYPSTQTELSSALGSVEYKVDGLLCFDKRGKYTRTSGVSALWLKLDMMEELLHYPPPESCNFRPTNEKEKTQRDFMLSKRNEQIQAQAQAQAQERQANSVEKTRVY